MKPKLSKRTVIFFALLILYSLVMPAIFAASGVPANIQSTLDKIVGVFTSNAIRAILMIAMGGIAVTMLINKDNSQVKKNLIGWLVGCGILTGLSTIVDWFMGSS